MTQNSPACPHPDRAASVPVPANNRSAITNGALPVDLRTAAGRRWRDIYVDTIERTGGRNEQLAKAYATAVVMREQIDVAVGAGRPVDIDVMLRCTSEVRRLMERLGLIDNPDGGAGVDATADVIAHIRAQAEATA